MNCWTSFDPIFLGSFNTYPEVQSVYFPMEMNFTLPISQLYCVSQKDFINENPSNSFVNFGVMSSGPIERAKNRG